LEVGTNEIILWYALTGQDITGIYHEKRATIISASIPKYVDGIRGCTTQAFPGATIGRITELLSRGKINISNIDIVIIIVALFSW
jgi:hypothetical protein